MLQNALFLLQLLLSYGILIISESVSEMLAFQLLLASRISDPGWLNPFNLGLHFLCTTETFIIIEPAPRSCEFNTEDTDASTQMGRQECV